MRLLSALAVIGITPIQAAAATLYLYDASGNQVATLDDQSVSWCQNATSATFATTATTASTVSDGAVTTAKLGSSAVTTLKIADLAVTTPKIADLAVTTPKIADGAVNAAKIANGALSAKLFPNYSAGSNIPIGQPVFAPTAGWIVVVMEGAYMNALQILVGPSNPPTILVYKTGDDFNNNTKAASAMIPVPAGMWFKVANAGPVGANVGHGFETVIATWFPVSG
jgi:hypothetical protein